MLLVGSQATKFWHPEWTLGKRPDFDILSSVEEAENLIGVRLNPKAGSWKFGDNIELHNLDYLNNRDVLRYTTDSKFTVNGIDVNVCSSRGLAAIKRAHLYRPFNFEKHIRQYQLLDRQFDALDWDFIRARNKLTIEEFGDIAGSKDMSNEKFFDNAVTQHIPHEEIHRIVAHYDKPIYLRLKRDFEKAAYEKDLWNALTHQDKILTIQEECYVIALERWLIPYAIKGRQYPYRMAFYKAVEKACTTLDRGLFREYSIDHWQEICQYNPNIFNHFLMEKKCYPAN